MTNNPIPPMTVNGHDVEQGCISDGARGQYTADHMADIAEGFGWMADHYWDDPRRCRELTTFDRSTRPFDVDDDELWEWFHEAYDNIMTWLNDHAVGCYFHEDDGVYLLDTRNPFAVGTSKVPDTGGYNPIAVMADGGELCEQCVRDPENPVTDAQLSNDWWIESDDTAWAVVGWTADGECEGPVHCDHCHKVLVEDVRP